MNAIFLKQILLFLNLVSLPFSWFNKNQVRVYLIGDSTMSVKEIKAYPETGWGMPFAFFFDSTVVVDNRAKNGRSTKTFISEDLWEPVVKNLQAGDFVLIQFGHNDEVKEKASFSTEEEFTANLIKFVTETQVRKGNPVLITPAARRRLDSSGRIQETHKVYSDLVRVVAGKYDIPLIDLDRKSQLLLQQYGEENSKLLFNWLEPGEHPNYPNGSKDNTHFNELGARKMAEIVLAEMKVLNISLCERIVKR